MITPLQVKFAKHCALVEVVEHFVYCGYLVMFPDDEFLVSKETVVLRRWERSKQKFGFIKRVDKG